MKFKKQYYDYLIITLALISVSLAITDYVKGLDSNFTILDNSIGGFFVIEYFVRLIISKNKFLFIKSNIIDLIAIIPFGTLFRVFRITKILKATKLLRLTKLTRLISVSNRLYFKCKNFFDTNGFKYVLLVCSFTVIVAAMVITYFEKMNFNDALWWAFVTATTVGYGDLSPTTGAGRIIAAILMIVGIGLIGTLTSCVTTFFMRERNKEIIISNDKVFMVHRMFLELNDEEKAEFLRVVGKD